MDNNPIVREIEQNRMNLNLGQQIAELRGIVIEGFKGVHHRQDIANGRTGKLEVRVGKLEKDVATSRGIRQGTWRFWLVLGSVIGLIIEALTIVALTGCWGLICR